MIVYTNCLAHVYIDLIIPSILHQLSLKALHNNRLKGEVLVKKFFSLLLIVTGSVLIIFASYQIYVQKADTKKSLVEAEQLLTEKNGDKSKNKDVSYQKNEAIGILHIPKIDGKLPIIKGTDEEMLAKGVGHYESTALPGENEQILLSGHRDTVFRDFGDLEVGDRFTVEMAYGTFEYEMKEAEIVSADDTTVIRPTGEEVLTLSTCYPFSYIGPAPDRYVIYAYPVK